MPFEHKNFPYAMRVGLDLRSCLNLTQLCNELDMNFDFLMVDVCHAQNFRDPRTIETRDIALTRSGKYISPCFDTLKFCHLPDTSIKYSWW